MAHAAERSVWVAVRARPLVARERLDAEACVSVDSAAGVVRLGSWRQFSYDHAFGPEAQQQDVYEGCVSSLVDSVLEGFNATVLAYGPTCSGKTHTMGMGRALHTMAEHHGIIPRVIMQLFDAIAAAPSTNSFVVKAQFLEIYNEELRDLLAGLDQSQDAAHIPGAGSSPKPSPAAAGCGSPSHARPIAIRECPDGQIMVTGAREVAAGSAQELLRLLDTGTLTRATSGTLLNEQSSRSHAIFSIILEQSISSPSNLDSRNLGPSAVAASSSSSRSLSASNDSQTPMNEPQSSSGNDAADTDSTQEADRTGTVNSSSSRAGEDGAASEGTAVQEYRISKFHLVDLAGSERVRRIGVTAGMRFKETVNINQGLLALGNVISALSDGERRHRHVPYRDSKLTRLLQDSLGGNSKTLMIACVSSADDVVEETLNTLKYAQRARTIRNRPVLNRQCLGEGPKALAAEIQALQLALLRRFTLQMQGVSRSAALPGVLMRDAAAKDGVGNSNSLGGGGDNAVDTSHKCVRMLQELQAMAASDWPLQLSTDASASSDRQLRPLTSSLAVQQLADLESKVQSANNHITRLELELDVCAAEQQAVQQAAGVLQEQQVAAWDALLQEVQSLHDAGQLTDSARQRLQELAQQQKQLPRLEGLVAALSPGDTGSRASLHSHPLPEQQSSLFDQVAAGQPPAVQSESVNDASTAAGVPNKHHADQKLSDLQAELAQKTALLQVAQGDLSRDEQIFADKVKEVERLQADLAAAAAHAQRREEALAAGLQHVQADMRRWRARALAVQQPSDDQQQQQGLPSPPSSAWQQASPLASPSSCRTGLQPEISFAAGLAKQQQQPPCPTGRPTASSEAATPSSDPADSQQQQSGAVGGPISLPPLQLDSSTELGSGHLRGRRTVNLNEKTGAAASEDDQVLFDADLLSYISDTDYTDLRCADIEVDNHLLSELQAVLADKAALEEEKAAAQAEAAAAQRAFEHAHAMLEGQLSQLSSAINSQEALIATLQANEAEAKNLGALYLERCRELEAQLAELNFDLEELTSEMTRVEADAAASADEKQQLRREYEAKLAAVAGLQQQMKQQDGARVEKERQRASSRVQQLQAELSSMRCQQDSLRQRLQERLTAQEKDAAAKARELSSLRQAAEAAKKRVAELEAENRRQRAALRARSNEAAAAQRQLRELASRVSPARSRQSQSPMTSPRTSSFKLSPQPSPRASAGTASPRTPAARTSPHWLAARTKSPARCRSDSPQQQAQQQQQQRGRRADPMGYAAHHASRIATQEPPSDNSSSIPQHHMGSPAGPQQKPAGAAGMAAAGGSSSGSRQMLTKQVALLVSEYLAKQKLKGLQSKQEAVQARRDVLLATKAQLELKQLRSCQLGAPGRACSSGSTGSEGGGAHADATDATDKVLLSDLTDQLDAVSAQLQHLEQLKRKAAADAASAADAAAELHRAAAGMTQQQLHELLGLALKELALQAAECQETVTQAKRLQVELSGTQQQLHEATCCLQMAQLQHQAQLSELQREHERRFMGLLRQLPGADQGNLPLRAGACDRNTAAASVSGQACGAGARAGAAQAPSSSDSNMHTQQSRLVGLLKVLAQQGTAEQQQKLLSTLDRLQQVHLAQQGHQQQQQQQQHTRLHAEQLQRLKQCRLQQRLEQQQQRQHDSLLSPCLQQQQPLSPLPAVGAPPPPQQQPQQQPLSSVPAVVAPPKQVQQQQAQLLEELQVSPQTTNAAAAAPAAPVGCDGLPSDSSSDSSGRDSSGSSDRGSGSDSDSDSDSSSSAGLEEPVVLRRTSTQSAASAAGSLRASATRLQAKLCSHRLPSSSSISACSSRILAGSDGGCGQLRSSSTVLIGSPRASLGGAGPTRAAVSVLATAQSHGGSPSRRGQGVGVPCNGAAVSASCVEEAGAAGDSAAGMLRKAAQLAVRSSVEATWRFSSSGGVGGRGNSSSGSSSGGGILAAMPAAVAGIADEHRALRVSASLSLPGRLSNCSGSSSSSLKSSSDGGGLQQEQQQQLASVAAASHRHRSSDDCLRPPSLNVSCSAVHHPGDRRHFSKEQLPSSSSSHSSSSSGGGSHRKASSPAPAFCRALVDRAVSGVDAGADDLDALPAAASLQQQPRSAYQAFKASAAAAAATAGGGRDQHPAGSGSPGAGAKSRRGGGGVPAASSSPSAYMKLLQGLD